MEFVRVFLVGLMLLLFAVVATLAEAPVQAAAGAAPVTLRAENRTVHSLIWGSGAYGVVLSHGAIYDAASWSGLAEAVAAEGMVVLAVEENAPSDLLAAARYLQEEHGVRSVALIGASAGGSTALDAVRQAPSLWDQLILLSASGSVRGLPAIPKLFVASEGEGMAETVRRMALEAPGTENEALILPGSAHAQAILQTAQGPRLTQAILNRLTARSQSDG